ncbi:MAG: glycosyltransferase [candidate division Zixibacteria bacterium]|nr:glycosyltransferase [candidate division Zixibacteria bacterium]
MDAIKKGEELFARGQIEDAEKHFHDIILQNPEQKEAYNNLGVIALQKQDIEQAIEYFTRSLAIDPFYKDALLNYSELARTVKSPSARIILKRYLSRYPQDKDVTRVLAEIDADFHKKGKIAFLTLPRWNSFLPDIVNHFQKTYEVRTCYSEDIKEIEAAVIWADIVWLEWANELAIILSNHNHNLLDNKHTVCRLHSYEALRGFAAKINWDKIDDLIFVADHIRTMVQQQIPQLSKKVRIHTIPNGINLERFPFRERKPGKNLAFLGSLNYKKGPMLLFHAFRELLRRNPDYHLHIGGEVKDARYRMYFDQMIREMSLEKNIHFDGWIDDVPAWLEDKHYIVCSSVMEGHPVGLMEAMACGLKPIVHNFVGARGIYPAEYIWNDFEEFIQLVTGDEYSPRAYREFVENNFPLEKQLKSIEKIINRTSNETRSGNGNNTEESEPLVAPAPSVKASAGNNGWPCPAGMFSNDPEERIKTLIKEVSAQVQQNRSGPTETNLLRLAKMTGYSNEAIVMNLTKLYQAGEDIPAIRELWRRTAVAALENNRFDDFLKNAYISIYAENLFSKDPNYKYATVDEDLNAFIRLAAKHHPLKAWVDENRDKNKFDEKLRIGFLLEGFSQNQAPSRTYYPLAEYHDRDRYELYFYSRWSLDEEPALKERYADTVTFLKQNDVRVRIPERQLGPMDQVNYLTRQIVNDGIDILVYQTTYFVPVYNFISALRPAPFQAALEHQQSEFSRDMDLIFTTRKQVPESSARTAPGVIPLTRKNNVRAARRSDFGIPDTAALLISVNRDSRYRQPEFWNQLRDALARNPEAYFMAVGLANISSNLPAGAPERKRIITPGYRTDIMELLAMADIYIDLFPSGAGSSLVEALLAGLPVLCFDQDYRTLFSVNDISLGADFVNHRDLVIPYGNRDKWQQTLDRLIHDKNWRHQLGREMVEQSRRFEPRRVAEKFFNHLEETYKADRTTAPANQ